MIVESEHADPPALSETMEKEDNSKEKNNIFDKIFKKKIESPAAVEAFHKPETPNEDQTDVSPPAADPPLVSDIINNVIEKIYTYIMLTLTLFLLFLLAFYTQYHYELFNSSTYLVEIH